MRLRALTSFSSTAIGNVESGSYLLNINEAFAKHLIEAGLAEIVKEEVKANEVQDSAVKPASANTKRSRAKGSSKS